MADSSPRYVAIITDGNGRWAKAHGKSVAAGHQAGADVVKARLRDAVELGIRELTVYSFSTENWSRSRAEVAALMRLFSERIVDETPELHEQGVRMRFIGRREGVSKKLAKQMDWAEETTAANDRITLFVAFNYGGRAEILDAAARYRAGARRRSAGCSTRPRCTTPISSSARAASASQQLPACGSRRTPSWCSATSCGRTSTARRSRRALAEYGERRRRFGGPLMAARGSDLGSRIVFGVPAVAFAIAIVVARRRGVRRRGRAARASSACTSCFDALRPRGAAESSPGSSA